MSPQFTFPLILKRHDHLPPPEICPQCGELVPPGSYACPECGADYNSGWKDAAGTEWEEDEFDHDEFVREEFGDAHPPAMDWKWRIGAVLAILALLFFMVLRIF